MSASASGPKRRRSLAERLRQWVKDSPAWAISIGLHLAVLLGATLIYIEQYLSQDEGEVVINMRQAELPKLTELDRKEKKPQEAPEDDPSSEEEPDARGSQDLGAEDAPLEGDASDIASNLTDPSVNRQDVSLGVVGGEGGRPVGFGGRAGRRRAARTSVELKKSEEGLLAALRWLARHQSPDGSWSASRFEKSCGRLGASGTCASSTPTGNEQYDVGVTALAILAFLGAAHLPSDREPIFPEKGDLLELSATLSGGRALTYGDVIRRALRFLTRAQGPSGLIGPEVDRAMYNHILATLALCEAYGLTGVSMLRDHAELAVQHLVAARSPGKGWRYAFQAQDTDSSVTGWAVIALRSAETVGIELDRALYQDVRRWLEAATVEARVAQKGAKDDGPAHLLTGYLGPEDAGMLVSVPGLNDDHAYTPASTAILVMATIFMEGKLVPVAERAIATLKAFPPPRWNPQDRSTWKLADFYYWYHATYAMFQVTKEDDAAWKAWKAAMEGALLSTQELAGARGRCVEGSWAPVDRWSCEGGRVYATAMNALTLEVHYRYKKILALPKEDRELFLK